MSKWTNEEIKRAREDFRVFVYIVWDSIGLPPPTPIQLDISKALQHPPSDRFIIQGFRGVAKSFLTCAYCVWQLWRNPILKVEIISASGDRADANAIFIKKIINIVDFLDILRLNEHDKRLGLRDTQNQFDVHGAVPDISPSVKSVGITGQITGTRADLLIADDVEVPNNSGTQVQRTKLSEAIKEFDAILKPNGQILYLGTPQNEMSIYNELQKRGYKTLIWSIIYPETPKERDFYGDRLAPLIATTYDKDTKEYAGKPTDPLRFDEIEIAKRRLSYGKAGFALQFLLNTNLSDHEKFPLKCSDLIIADLDLETTSVKWDWAKGREQLLQDVPCTGLRGDYFYAPMARSIDTAPYTGTVMFIDPSGRGKDETAYAIMKYLNGYLFLMEVGGYKDGYTDATLQTLATKAKYYSVNDVVVEPNFGDGMFTKLITPVFHKIHPCNVVEAPRATKQKEMRIIDTLEPVIVRHKLIVNKQVILDDYNTFEKDANFSLIYQMTRISKDRGSLAHDDRLDAVTGAVAFWLDVMDRDAQIGMDEILAEQLEQWLDPDRGIFFTTEKQQLNNGNKYNILQNFLN